MDIIKIVEIIIINPIISVKENSVPSHRADMTVAATGSMLEIMLVFVAPIR